MNLEINLSMSFNSIHSRAESTKIIACNLTLNGKNCSNSLTISACNAQQVSSLFSLYSFTESKKAFVWACILCVWKWKNLAFSLLSLFSSWNEWLLWMTHDVTSYRRWEMNEKHFKMQKTYAALITSIFSEFSSGNECFWILMEMMRGCLWLWWHILSVVLDFIFWNSTHKQISSRACRINKCFKIHLRPNQIEFSTRKWRNEHPFTLSWMKN